MNIFQGYSTLLEKRSTPSRKWAPFNNYKKFNSATATVHRITKNKNRIIMSTFQSKERKRFKKMLVELIAQNQPSSSSVSSSSSTSKTISTTKLTNNINNESITKSELSKISEKPLDKMFNVNNELNENKQNKSAQILKWQLPANSSNYKLSMKNLSSESDIHTISYSTNKQYSNTENQLIKKIQISYMLRKSREFFKFKSFLTPIPTFVNRFLKSYIPFRQHDREISESQLSDIYLNLDNEVNKIIDTENRLIVSEYSISIYTNDLLTLCDSNWLNDAVI